MRVLLLVFLTAAWIGAPAQDRPDDIDSVVMRMEECLQADSIWSTRDMMRCTGRAALELDTLMNLYYNLLLDSLPYPEKLVLVGSQNAWVEHYEKACEWSAVLYGGVLQGTMWLPVAVNDQMKMVRDRARQMKSHFEMVAFRDEEP